MASWRDKPHTAFSFVNTDEFDIFHGSQDSLEVHIDRRPRQKNLPKMRQPENTATVIGWCAALELKDKGLAAKHRRWYLLCGKKIIQRGRTDNYGESDYLDIRLYPTREYTLVVF